MPLESRDESRIDKGQFEPLQIFEKKAKESSQELSQVKVERRHNGVHLVALSSIEVNAPG